MANVAEQKILGMSLPLDMCVRQKVTLFELKYGNLHHSQRHLARGETITIEEIAKHGDCQDVFLAARIQLDGQTYWAAVRELEPSVCAKVA